MDGEASRPWVSEVVWALYSAYSTIVFYAISQIIILRIGEDVRKLISPEKVLNMLQAAIPNSNIISVDNNKLNLYLQNLENNLINELQSQILDHEPDQERIESARIAIRLAEEIKNGSIAKNTAYN